MIHRNELMNFYIPVTCFGAATFGRPGFEIVSPACLIVAGTCFVADLILYAIIYSLRRKHERLRIEKVCK